MNPTIFRVIGPGILNQVPTIPWFVASLRALPAAPSSLYPPRSSRHGMRASRLHQGLRFLPKRCGFKV